MVRGLPASIARPFKHHLYLREFVVTTVILAPGACGREAPSSTRCAVSAAAAAVAAAAAAGDEFRDLNFEQPFHHFCSLLVAMPPLNSPPATSGGRARPWDVLWEPWGRFGRVWRSSGRLSI